MEKSKASVIAAISVVMSWLGVLAVPIFLLVGCNLLDYITGLLAAKYRNEPVSSYKGMRGIVKKVCMWLLVVVGSCIDILISHTFKTAGIDIIMPYVVAIVVTVWLVVNEIISILENMMDIGVKIPPFLMPLVKNIKKKVEDNTRTIGEERDEGY